MEGDGKYTVRELDHYFGDLRKDVKDIKEQTTKTNGRVGRLENWKSFMQGGLAILTILIVPILIFVITHWVEKI